MSTPPELRPDTLGEDGPIAGRPRSELNAGARRTWPPVPAGVIRVVLGASILAVTALMAANTDPSVVEVNLFRLVAAVLTYRTVTYWLPVIPGMFAVRALRSRQLL